MGVVRSVVGPTGRSCMEPLDINANRQSRKYSAGIQIRRIAWGLVSPLFRFSPRPCFGWRRTMLRAFGARVGASVHVYPSAQIVMPWNVEIGDESAIDCPPTRKATNPP